MFADLDKDDGVAGVFIASFAAFDGDISMALAFVLHDDVRLATQDGGII